MYAGFFRDPVRESLNETMLGHSHAEAIVGSAGGKVVGNPWFAKHSGDPIPQAKVTGQPDEFTQQGDRHYPNNQYGYGTDTNPGGIDYPTYPPNYTPGTAPPSTPSGPRPYPTLTWNPPMYFPHFLITCDHCFCEQSVQKMNHAQCCKCKDTKHTEFLPELKKPEDS